MDTANCSVETLEDVKQIVRQADIPATRSRNFTSAIDRICRMAGLSPASVRAEPSTLRAMLRKIRPAAHGIRSKTWANLLSQFRTALVVTGVIDATGRGGAMRDPVWGPLAQAIAPDKRLSTGLASFSNWCVGQRISAEQVDDAAVQGFQIWLEDRTLCPKPRDIVRRVPNVWNEAGAKIESWPKTKLTKVSFRGPPKRLQWKDLSESFGRDVKAYLAMRAEPDLFDERPNAPRRPLAASTLHQQGEHLRLAASVLIESGVAAEEIASLADLVKPERVKTVLRYYHQRANSEPNAFVICLATTLIQVAQYYLGTTADELARLKGIAAKLPPVPFDLTAKNKNLLRQFESERLRAALLFLPEKLMAEVERDLEQRLRFVDAQVAVAIDVLLVIPLRPQNLSCLHWQRHFSEPDGSRGRLLLHIPAQETKSRLQEIVAEVPEDVARRLRWYRRHVLPCLNADVNGFLFVTGKGSPKGQDTLTDQIIKTIAKRIGIHLTPHQPRHLAATWYLEEHPEDFETPKAFLGHAWSKTTRIYAGSSSRRASRAYNEFVFKQRDALKLKRKRQLNRQRKKGTG